MKWLPSLVAAAAAATGPLGAQDLAEVRVGHWIEARGELLQGDVFRASALELAEPGEEEALVGVVTEVGPGASWFTLLGQRVRTSDKTTWRNVTATSVLGERVKVEGYYRGPRNFSARSVSPRGAGRERVAGRVDAVRAVEDGIEIDVMRYRVLVPGEAALEREVPLEDYALVPPRGPTRLEVLEARARDVDLRVRDDDDEIPTTLRLGEELFLGLRLETKLEDERELDLNEDDDEDRVDLRATLRGELLWLPTAAPDFTGLLGFRESVLFREDDEDGHESDVEGRLVEAFGLWRNVYGPLDVQLGRQDFDEPREWLWDEHLDALRLTYDPGDWKLELAAATTLSDGSERQKETDTLLAYLTNDDDDRTVGAYVIDRRTELEIDDYPIHFGVRAFGEWLPESEVWAEAGIVRGYEEDVDLKGWGYDLGATWIPEALDPWYFTAGWAFGSGDDDLADGEDRSFRQTGLHDNNAKLGGVTSFRYYGEVFDPELSNLHVLTLGIGRRIDRRHSVDLVFHHYEQDEPAPFLRDADIDAVPDGRHRSLGQELDLIVGGRPREGLHIELVLGAFEPGSAFDDDAETAWIGKLQLRFRF